MKKLYAVFLLALCQEGFSQCTPANLLATSQLNTPAYTLNTLFNGSATAATNITNLSNGIINFTGSVGGTAVWTTAAGGGIEIQNDATVGNYIFVQPQTTDNVTTLNVATYTFTFTQTLYNISFRCAGLNNTDQIHVTAFNGVTPIAVTAANFSALDAGITITGGNTLTGTSTAGGTSVNANRATISFAGPITSIVLTSGKSDDNNSTVTLGFTSFAYTRCVNVPADFNNAFTNVAVSGNVSTNDVVPAGTMYGAPTAKAGNPGPALPVINTNGTYTFTSAIPGLYKFSVPMCPPGIVVPDCPNVPLYINVISPLANTNAPSANIDRATTALNTAVTLQTLANDRPGNNTTVILNPASVTVTAAPLNGTTSVNAANGNITYTPNAGFTGFDTLTYRVCDQSHPAPLCATSIQIITVQPTGIANNTAAADDYNNTPLNTPVSGNVKINDNDPQSNTQTVTLQNSNIPGVGSLALATDGTYTFTPAAGYSGPANFPYQTCDNGAPVACTNATLYLLVFPNAILPLKITSFSAVTQKEDVQLYWVYESALNVSYFEIERAAYGSPSFTKVGIVNATGNTAGAFSFIDYDAHSYITKGLYRLKIVDADGRFSYSNILPVNFGKELTAEVRSNITKAGTPVFLFTGTSSAPGTLYTASLYNQTGQLLQHWESVTGTAKNIQTNNLTPGIYLLKINLNDQTVTQTFIIQ